MCQFSQLCNKLPEGMVEISGEFQGVLPALPTKFWPAKSSKLPMACEACLKIGNTHKQVKQAVILTENCAPIHWNQGVFPQIFETNPGFCWENPLEIGCSIDLPSKKPGISKFGVEFSMDSHGFLQPSCSNWVICSFRWNNGGDPCDLPGRPRT